MVFAQIVRWIGFKHFYQDNTFSKFMDQHLSASLTDALPSLYNIDFFSNLREAIIKGLPLVQCCLDENHPTPNRLHMN